MYATSTYFLPVLLSLSVAARITSDTEKDTTIQSHVATAVWDANEEPLPDILGPPLRSVSSLVMYYDADESVPTAARNYSHSTTATSGAATDFAVSGAMGSKMVDTLLTPLPPRPTPMDPNDQLIREQPFPPPFRARLGRDQSFPPMDLPRYSPSLRSGWSTAPTSNSGGGSMAGGGFVAGEGVTPSLSTFHGSGFVGAPPPDQETAGEQLHRGDGNGGSSLGGSESQHGVYYDSAPSSSSRPRHSSFDKLAEMIPGIPHWASRSLPSMLSPLSGETAGEFHDSVSSNTTKGASAEAPIPKSTPSAEGSQQSKVGHFNDCIGVEFFV